MQRRGEIRARAQDRRRTVHDPVHGRIIVRRSSPTGRGRWNGETTETSVSLATMSRVSGPLAGCWWCDCGWRSRGWRRSNRLHPRLREARKEPGELTGGGLGRGLTGRRRRCGGCQPGADRDILLYRKTEAWVRRGGARSTMGLESCRCQVEKRNGRHRSGRHAAVGRYDDAVPGIVRTVRLATTRRSPRLSEAGGPAHQVCPTDARGLSGTAPDARGG